MTTTLSQQQSYLSHQEESSVDDHVENEMDVLLISDNTSNQSFCVTHPKTSRCCQCSSKPLLLFIVAFSAVGSFLYGYNGAVVSGAMLKVNSYFNLDPIWHELIVTVMIAAVAIGAGVASPLSERLGRKPVIVLASLIFTLGAVVLASSPNQYALLCGRMIIGLGGGFMLTTVPIYIAELSPSHLRGKLVVLSVTFTCAGQLVAVLLNGAFSSLSLEIGWRLMFGVIGLPAAILFIGFIFMPETPRWLLFHGKHKKAESVLLMLRDEEKVEEELKAIENDFMKWTEQKLGFLTLLKKFFTSRAVLLALLVGCGLQMIQQLTGANTIFYYGASVIKLFGFNDNTSIWLSAIPTATNTIFTLVGIFFVDYWGRRKLLIVSLGGVVFGLILLSMSFVLNGIYSSPADPLIAGTCQYTSCGACVSNSQCGFCAIYNEQTDEYLNGTCAPGNREHSLFTIHNTTGICEVYSSTEDLIYVYENSDQYYSYNVCPDSKFSWLSILALLVFIVFFAPGLGPLTWTINSEIYPTWARSAANALATTTYSISNVFVSLTFLTLSDVFGPAGIFGMYAGLALLGLLFIMFLLPETKGKSLEEIELLFKKPYFLKWCSQERNQSRTETYHVNEMGCDFRFASTKV